MLDSSVVVAKLNRIEQLLVLLVRTQLAPVLQKELADPRMLQL